MSNPGSPAVPSESVVNRRRESKSDNGNSNVNEGIISSCNNGNRENSVAAHLDPFVRLDPLEVSDGQLQSIKKKTSSTGILNKSGKGGNPESIASVADLKMETPDNSTGGSNPNLDISEGHVSTTPSIVKPRRPSVHFAVDADAKVRIISSSASERSKQDGSGSNRKHRSRKEKLVCRSESPSDLGMESNENRKSSNTALSTNNMPQTSQSSVSTSITAMTSASNESAVIDRVAHGLMKMNPPVALPPPRGTPSLATSKVKSRVKRTSSGNTSNRVGGSRKNSPSSNNSGVYSSNREPVVKRKKVIEIVSPRKRKMDHLDIVKISSDPIFIRAANKPFKLKNKSQHNRFKFSRVSLNKSSSHHSGARQRRASSASVQQGSSASVNKQRLVINSPLKKEQEAEPPCFPPSLIDDLLWVLEDAEKEFSPDRSQNKTTTAGTSAGSRVLPSSLGIGLRESSDPVAGGSSAVRKLTFGRRRVESEPPGLGFDLAPTPGSPSGSQPFYHVRKEVYFSPSPSYSAPGPTGRRRYSRRRHARIHPPFDDSNCLFQGHHCPNSKVTGSQYCEKHLDQGPTASYSHCKYMKDGRQCGNLFSNFDSTLTFCEQHAHRIAKAEYDLRNPQAQPDAAKNLLAKINKIFTEGLSKTEVENLDVSSASPDILQLIEEPDIIEDLPLGNFTGGLLEEIDAEGERNVNPDKPDYDALKNAGYFTTEEIIQIHVSKLRKLKAFYVREKELEWLIRQHKLKFYKEGLEKLKQFGPRFTTNPYLISRNIDLPKEYIDHQIKHYDAAKAILQTAYKADGEKGLLRLKMLQKTQELASLAKASGQKQHDTVDVCDSETDVDSDGGEARDRRDSSRYTGSKLIKCAYNEGYAIRACQNPPVCWSNYCYKHILSDPKQVQWIPCGRRIGPDPQDTCKTPCLKILQKHGCAVHAPLVMSKHKPLRRSEEELNLLADSDLEEEEVTLEDESQVLANLVSDECVNVSHLDEMINQVGARGPFEITDTSDSEETDEECGSGNLLSQDDDDDAPFSEQIP